MVTSRLESIYKKYQEFLKDSHVELKNLVPGTKYRLNYLVVALPTSSFTAVTYVGYTSKKTKEVSAIEDCAFIVFHVLKNNGEIKVIQLAPNSYGEVWALLEWEDTLLSSKDD